MRPCLSAGTVITRFRPNPTSESALSTEACTSFPTTTLISGAPNSPCSSTFQPARFSRACRAAAKQLKLAVVAPVTKPTPQEEGSRKTSRSQPAVTSSRNAATGDWIQRPAFWSQAPANQFAASAAGAVALQSWGKLCGGARPHCGRRNDGGVIADRCATKNRAKLQAVNKEITNARDGSLRTARHSCRRSAEAQNHPTDDTCCYLRRDAAKTSGTRSIRECYAAELIPSMKTYCAGYPVALQFG